MLCDTCWFKYTVIVSYFMNFFFYILSMNDAFYTPRTFLKKKERKNKICALTFRIKESNFDKFDNKCKKKV